MKHVLASLIAIFAFNGAAPAETLTPVDVPNLRARIIASEPTGPVELRIRNKGRILFTQGQDVTVFTKAGGGGPKVHSAMTELSGNRFCISEARNWSGICVEMFRSADGGYICRGQYGNGASFGERDCWIKIPR